LPSLYLTVHWLSLLNHNTYMEVKEWLENDIRHSAVVYTFDPLVYTAPSYETAWYEINKNYNLVSKKFDYIVQNKDSFEGKGVMLLNDKRNNRYKELGGEDTEYVIVCDSSTVHEIEKYHKISLILSFNPIGNNGKKDNIKGDALNSPVDYISIISLDKSGPPLEIYKVLQ